MPIRRSPASRWIRRLASAGLAVLAAAAFAVPGRAETTFIVEYDPDPCQRVAALAEGEGSNLSVGPVSLDVKTFAYMTCEKVREEIVASINEHVDKVRTAVDAQVQEGVNYIYDSFYTWLSLEVYARLPEADKARIKPEEHFQEWLKHPDQEFSTYVNWYFREKAPTIYKLLERYRKDTSGEIIDGLKTLWSSAREKLEKLDQAYEEIKANPDTPYADILEKYGLSGAWVDKLKDYEGRFALFDQEWGIVEASKTMYEAFTADSYAGQLEGTFALFEQMGGLMEDSRVPGISLMGTLVKSYGQMAKEILQRANELGELIRKREGWCIGADTHTLLDDRSQALMAAFGDGVQVCPLDDKKEPEKDIYVQTEPNDMSQLYFWLDGGFIKGEPGGGGVDALKRVRAFISNAAGIGFAPYEGKENDLATIVSVYNTPYRPDVALADLPGHRPGSGLPGLLAESGLLFDSIVARVKALKGAFAPDAACGDDAFNAWIERESGLRVADFPLDDSASLEKLKTSYALGFIQGHNLVPGAAVVRTQAYATYRPMWPRLKDLSFVAVTGEVRDAAHVSEPCVACAGAALDIAVDSGEALCPVGAADDAARFRQRVSTRSNAVSLRLSARQGDAASETYTVDQRHFGIEGAPPPFTASFALSLFVPLEREPLDAETALARLRGLLGKAEAAHTTAAEACSSLEAALAVLDEALPDIATQTAALQADETALAADAARIRQFHGKAQSLSDRVDEASLKVVESKDLVESKAEAACDAAATFQATDEENKDERARLLKTARDEAAAARSAAATAAASAETAQQAARAVTDAVRRGEDLGARLGRIRDARRALSERQASASDAVQTASEATASLEASAADLSALAEEARQIAAQASGALADASQSAALAEITGLVAVIEGYAADAETCRTRNAVRSANAQSAWAELAPAPEAAGEGGADEETELRLMVADLQAFGSLASAGADVAEIYAAAAADGAAQAETCASLSEGMAQGGDAAIAAAVSAAIDQCDFAAAESGLAEMAPGEQRDRLSERLAEAKGHESAAAAKIGEAQNLAQSDRLQDAKGALASARNEAVCDDTKVRIDDLLASLEEGGGGFQADAAFWAGPWKGTIRLSSVEVDGRTMDGAGLIGLIDREMARIKAEEQNKSQDDGASLGAAIGDAIASGIAEAVAAIVKVGVAVLNEGVVMTYALQEEGGSYRLRAPGEGALADQANKSLQEFPLFVPTASGDLQITYPFPEGGGGLTALLLRPDEQDGNLTLRIELRGTDTSPPDESVLSVRAIGVVVEGTFERGLMTVDEAAAIVMPQVQAAIARYAPELNKQ